MQQVACRIRVTLDCSACITKAPQDLPCGSDATRFCGGSRCADRVTSLIELIRMPSDASARTLDSRPAGP